MSRRKKPPEPERPKRIEVEQDCLTGMMNIGELIEFYEQHARDTSARAERYIARLNRAQQEAN